MLSRNTYLEIDLKSIKRNVEKLIQNRNEYDYYFGVVKADCYGQSGIETVKAVIQGGCNYLAVATLEEAMYIREKMKDIPILCLGVISSEYINKCIQNHITVTVNSLGYLKEILTQDCHGLKVHLKVNTGMNRLGIEENKQVLQAITLIRRSGMVLEGIYTHIYYAASEKDYLKQIEQFKIITQNVDFSQIPIVHIAASEAFINYPKLDFVNGCRLGIIMYGLTEKKNLNLETTARLVSEVVQINSLRPGDIVGYNGTFKAEEETKIAVVSIGYADGIIRKNKGRNVYINNKPYEIVGNICMDMLFVKVDDDVKLHDKVYLLKDNTHIEEVAKYLDTIPYEVLCSIGKRVPRICKN